MNELITARKIAAQILQQVLDGKISPEEARKRWPECKGDTSLDSAYHTLYHFEDDVDIRQKDQKYAEWQIGQIERMITSFKTGNSLDDELIKE